MTSISVNEKKFKDNIYSIVACLHWCLFSFWIIKPIQQYPTCLLRQFFSYFNQLFCICCFTFEKNRIKKNTVLHCYYSSFHTDVVFDFWFLHVLFIEWNFSKLLHVFVFQNGTQKRIDDFTWFHNLERNFRFASNVDFAGSFLPMV